MTNLLKDVIPNPRLPRASARGGFSGVRDLLFCFEVCVPRISIELTRKPHLSGCLRKSEK